MLNPRKEMGGEGEGGSSRGKGGGACPRARAELQRAWSQTEGWHT